MKFKNAIFVNGFVTALKQLLNEKLPVSQSFKLIKFGKEVEEMFKVYDEARMALVKKYAELDENGEIVTNEDKTAKIADIAEFNKEFAELLNQEEEYEVEKVRLNDDITISGSDLVLLEDLIEAE